MYKAVILFLLFSVHSCKSEKEIEKIKHCETNNKHQYNKFVTNDFETFDIKRFDKNKDETNDYVYQLKDGTNIMEFGEEGSAYFSDSRIKNSLYIIRKEFNSRGIIRTKGVNFTSDCRIGIWYEFDESGKLIKETDHNKPYTILVEDIIEFFKKNKAKFEAYLAVKRYIDDKTKMATWQLYYDGLYKDKYGRYQVKIDDQSREIQEVIRVTGRDGEREVVFKK